MPPRNAPSQRPRDVIQRSKRNNVPGILQFPKDLGAHSMLMVFNDYEYQRPGTRTLNKVGATTYSARNLKSKSPILLPLPANIQDTYDIRVQGFEAGISGEQVSAAAGAFAGGTDLTLSQLGSIIMSAAPDIDIDFSDLKNINFSSITQALAAGNRAAGFFGRRTLDTILPGANRNIDVGLGNTLNPKASLYFEGVGLKRHSFNWNFAPTEESESEIIKNITDTIKSRVLPTYQGTLGFKNVLLSYPSTVDIFFFGVDQDYFLYYKTCMVQQFITNYTPAGLALVRGGKPAAVTMSMDVIEMDIHTAEDYGGSPSPGIDYTRTFESEE